MTKLFQPIALLVLALFSSSFLTSCENEKPQSPVINHWISQSQEDLFLHVKADNTIVSNVLGKEFYGVYTLEGDSFLSINIPIQNEELMIDSMSTYFNEIGAPSLSYFSEGELVATRELGVTQSAMENKRFEILELGSDKLVLEDENSVLYSFIVKMEKASMQSTFSFMSILRGLLGMAFLLLVAFIFSTDRKNIDWRLVGIGLGLQIVLALLVLKVPFVKSIFDVISKGFVTVLNFTKEG